MEPLLRAGVTLYTPAKPTESPPEEETKVEPGESLLQEEAEPRQA